MLYLSALQQLANIELEFCFRPTIYTIFFFIFIYFAVCFPYFEFHLNIHRFSINLFNRSIFFSQEIVSNFDSAFLFASERFKLISLLSSQQALNFSSKFCSFSIKAHL